jgi:uncharacterized protein YfaS (alpha-2-macroglobulin family)
VRSQSGLLDASYVCSFWGEQQELDHFLQAYAVEKAKLEARKKGYAVNEQTLQDGAIKVQIIDG